MGTLKPGASYIYERVGGTVYARESGSNPMDRFIIGQDYNNEYMQSFAEQYYLETEWKDIIKEARTNPVLQEALDRVKITYYLSKKDGEK
jgi:hypothetical protein